MTLKNQVGYSKTMHKIYQNWYGDCYIYYANSLSLLKKSFQLKNWIVTFILTCFVSVTSPGEKVTLTSGLASLVKVVSSGVTSQLSDRISTNAVQASKLLVLKERWALLSSISYKRLTLPSNVFTTFLLPSIPLG